jgi:hypothetical protein
MRARNLESHVDILLKNELDFVLDEQNLVGEYTLIIQLYIWMRPSPVWELGISLLAADVRDCSGLLSARQMHVSKTTDEYESSIYGGSDE